MNQLLDYMKGALEGTDGLPPFVRWFAENDAALQELCSRGSYLRLREEPFAEFAKILKKHGVDYNDTGTAYLPRGPRDCSRVRREWLTSKVFPYSKSPTHFAQPEVAYVDEYLHMIDLKQTGDELWFFSTPSRTWQTKCGQAGIALVRDGRVIYAIVTMRN